MIGAVPRRENPRWAVCRRGGLDLAYCPREGSRVAQRAIVITGTISWNLACKPAPVGLALSLMIAES